MKKLSIVFIFIFLSLFLVACEKEVDNIRLNKDDITLKIGEKYSLVATFIPKDATNKELTWESSDEEIATVDNGLISTLHEGTVLISAKSNNNKIARCKVTITKTVTETTGQIIELNKDNYQDYIEFTFGQNETRITCYADPKLNYKLKEDYIFTFSTRVALVYKNRDSTSTYYLDYEFLVTDYEIRDFIDVYTLATNKIQYGYRYSSYTYTDPVLVSVEATVYN